MAAAVQEEVKANGAFCCTVDALSLLSERTSAFASHVHTHVYRHVPGVWRTAYQVLEQHPPAREGSFLARVLTLGTKNLYGLVVREGYDCLICPHVFSALMVTQLRKAHPELTFYAAYIATDYTCTPYVVSSRMDRYFFPSAASAEACAAAGIPAGQITVTPGVPVRQAFYTRTEKKEARQQLGLPQTGRMLLLMGGSMGCGRLDRLTEILAERLPKEDTLGVVCGTNSRLQKRLEGEYTCRPNVHIWGYWDDMSLLMDSADMYLTKAGGVSSSEAAVKGLPMVLIDAVSACEGPNLRHFCTTGGAVTASGPIGLADLCLRLLADDAAREKMSAALTQEQNAAETLWSQLLEDLPEREAAG